MTDLVSGFINDESGASTLEYSLLVACIALVAIIAVNTIGTSFAATLWESSIALNPGTPSLQMGVTVD